jgi:hypothetical protein
MTPSERLFKLEERADQRAAALSLLKLPIRVVYTAISETVFALYHNARPERRPAGSSLASRLSYIAPLLSKAPAEPLGESASEALSVYAASDSRRAQLPFLLSYAQLHEIMPEVRREYYSVSGGERGKLRLRHVSEEFAAFEARDVLLVELARPWVQIPPSAVPARGALLDHGQTLNPTVLHNLKNLAGVYRGALMEIRLLDDAAFEVAVGASPSDFIAVQSTLFAIADYAILRSRGLREPPHTKARSGEAFEWSTLLWKEGFFLGLLEALTGVSATAIDNILSHFSMDFRTGAPDTAHAGDGFFPPIVMLPGAVMVSPDLLRGSVHVRNVLYGIGRRDRSTFDSLISSSLEPTLISQAYALFSSNTSLIVRHNVSWSGGEIDLLVYDPSDNSAIHVQAKAAAPPQGARMVQRLEGRIREGLDQLSRFKALPQSTQDETLSRALGTSVRNVTLYDVVLSRSGFGTYSVVAGARDVTFLSLPVLAIITERARKTSIQMDVHEVLAASVDEVTALVAEARPVWEERDLVIDRATLVVPMLQYDKSAIERRHMVLADAGNAYRLSMV